MAFKLKTSTVSSAARSAPGDSGPLSLTELGGQLTVFVAVTATTVPSLALSVEWSHDGATFFKSDPADAFTAITTTGSVAKIFTVKAPIYRIVWAIGSGSATFQAHEYVTSL